MRRATWDIKPYLVSVSVNIQSSYSTTKSVCMVSPGHLQAIGSNAGSFQRQQTTRARTCTDRRRKIRVDSSSGWSCCTKSGCCRCAHRRLMSSAENELGPSAKRLHYCRQPGCQQFQAACVSVWTYWTRTDHCLHHAVRANVKQ